ncbi:HEPN domain-containing protein [Paenarthrobacter sp. NPDC090517]|uniref:HEPN domain-containing protein n=1 Tax=Paenarthrobacter sp. NPDC090517 TaxID=3364381 RepID=UPI0037F59C25
MNAETRPKLIQQRQVLLGTPGQEPTTPATLSLEDQCFRLRPEKWVEEPQQVSLRRTSDHVTFDLGNRRGVVEDFEPRPLWGLEDGNPFTVLDARMSVELGTRFAPLQVYETESILWGVHVDGPNSHGEAVRLSFSLSRGDWVNDEPITLAGGRLSPWSQGNRPGLTWEPSSRHTVHSLTQRFPTLLTALFHLWTGSPTGVCVTQVHMQAKGWCDWEFVQDAPPVASRSLLPLNKLDLKVVAVWLSKAKKLGPIPFVATEDRGVLQVDAQMLATALEGLHRRLVPDANRFNPPLSRNKLEKVKSQATNAAVVALEGVADASVAKRAYNEAMSHVDQLSYAERLTEMLPRVNRIATGLLGPSLESWINATKDVRNVQSHGLPEDDEFGEEEISRYYVLSVSIRWALRILLLLELVDDALIRSALQDSDKFMYALANIDREDYWKDFSAYEAFLNSPAIS